MDSKCAVVSVVKSPALWLSLAVGAFAGGIAAWVSVSVAEKERWHTTVQIVQTPAAPDAIGPYSQGMVVARMLYTAGQIPLDPQTMEIVQGGIEAQTSQVLKNLDAVLAEAGASWESVVKSTVFLTDMNDFAAFNSVYEQHINPAKPARSTVQVAALPKGAAVEIELIARITSK